MYLEVVPVRIVVVCLGLFYAAAQGALRADEHERLRVGVQPDGRIVVPTNQVLTPAGKQITFPGRPVDLALAEGGKTLVVKNMHDLVFIDVATAAVKQTLALPRRRASPPSRSGTRASGPYSSASRATARRSSPRRSSSTTTLASLPRAPATSSTAVRSTSCSC